MWSGPGVAFLLLLAFVADVVVNAADTLALSVLNV